MKKRNDHSTIEGCIRQSQDIPLKKDNNYMWYVDHEMLLVSSMKRDHEYIKHKLKQQDGSDTTNN